MKRSIIVLALVVGLLMVDIGGSVAYADSLQQITFDNGKNCQVSTIAGQTYVNC